MNTKRPLLGRCVMIFPMGKYFRATITLDGEVTQNRLNKIVSYLDLIKADYPDDEEIVSIPASLDYSRFPREMAGRWVVVCGETRRLLGSGDSPESAINKAGLDIDDSHGFVIAKVPPDA